MNRPSPRKSSLSGSSPVAPPPAETPETKPTPAAARAAAAKPVAAPVTRKAEEPSTSGKKKWRHKVSFYQDPADTDRVRGAILHTMVQEGNRNLSQFVNDAVMAKVEELEAKYNHGEPFPAVGARELPQGGAAAAGE
ncbi:ParB family protein [Propionibacterium freudenreichii]|uniref:ParB family protein n=1 Tax=Propionibacterium freudenreichii TaxID=1744 RepID=UPI0021A7BBE0|nr:hypothetical protein [Propionibacterium freudenreichii]MCT2980611.1 hypothetical protein [Propionibacterium freudenreichii]